MTANLKQKGTLFVATLLLCLGAMVTFWCAAGRPAPSAAEQTITVKRGALPVTITEVGQLEPKEYDIITAPISGVLVELIKEGSYVHKGDVVARMNDDEAREELETERIAIENRKALLREAELDLKLTEKDLEYERQKAEIELKLAQLELDELLKKPAAPVLALAAVDTAYWRVADEAAMKLAKLDVEYASVAEETALKRYDRQKSLAEKGVASENDVADARLKYEKERTTHENARIILELLQKGTPESEIEVAREKVKQAKIKLDQIKQSAAVQIDLKKTAIAVTQAEHERTNESLAIHKKILESTVVKTPVEGTVLYWGQWGRPHEGDHLWRGNGFLSITQMGKMVVLTRVNEVDSRRIGVGQKALIRLEAMPDKIYHGEVTRIAGLATDRDERFQGVLRKDLSGVMVFEVTVEIREHDVELLPTMSATVEIIAEELQNIIAVPFSVIIERDGKKFVRVMENGRTVEREVRTGRSSKSRIVITQGLDEGDVVCWP